MEDKTTGKRNFDAGICLIAKKAEEDLDELLHEDAAKKAKRLAKWALGRGDKVKDEIFWPAGMLLLGLLEAGEEGNTAAEDAAENYLDRWILKGGKICHTDDALTGYVLVRLYLLTKKDSYKKAADACYLYLTKAQKDEKGSVIYNPNRQNSCIFADGAGQTSLFLSSYGAAFGRDDALDLAALQLQNFIALGFDKKSGLPYHGYDAGTGVKQGIIGWGRAAGWLLMGFSETIAQRKVRNAEGAEDPLMEPFISFTRTVKGYVREDGLYSWALPCMEGPLDTSATGMILWALKRARAGGIPVIDESEIEKQMLALLSKSDRGTVLSSSAECIDFGQYVQRYESNPWGQGAVLAALAGK